MFKKKGNIQSKIYVGNTFEKCLKEQDLTEACVLKLRREL